MTFFEQKTSECYRINIGSNFILRENVDFKTPPVESRSLYVSCNLDFDVASLYFNIQLAE